MLFPYHIPQWCMTPEIKKVRGFICKRKILALLNILLLFLNKRPSEQILLLLLQGDCSVREPHFLWMLPE